MANRRRNRFPDDPVVAEVRRARAAIMRAAGGSLTKAVAIIQRDAAERARAAPPTGRKVVSTGTRRRRAA
ncbi:MAG: hypothetical protein ACKVS8_09225 [Phycisphaerales bacterium]